MSANAIPVLIAGGGPVGLALAIELGRAGIECLVVEKRDGSISIPKMSGLSIRSMEFNRRWGIAEIVQNSGWPKTHPQGLIYCTSMVGFELARRGQESKAEKAGSQIEFADHVETMEDMKTASRVFLGLGSVALVTGGVLYFLNDRRESPAPVAFGCSPHGCAATAQGTF